MSTSVDRFVLRVRIEDAAAAELRSILELTMESHAAVSRAGGFSNPERDRAADLEFAVSGEPNEFEYRAQAREVDRGGWRILLDAVRGELWVRGFAEQSSLGCSLLGPNGDNLATEAVGSLPYPVSPSRPPFKLLWTEDSAPWRAAIHVHFQRVPDRKTAEEIERFLVHWQRLIRAYRPPDDAEYPEYSECAFGGAAPTVGVWSQPRVIELGLDSFLADEAVFHPVVNYACWLHRRVAIQELVID